MLARVALPCAVFRLDVARLRAVCQERASTRAAPALLPFVFRGLLALIACLEPYTTCPYCGVSVQRLSRPFALFFPENQKAERGLIPCKTISARPRRASSRRTGTRVGRVPRRYGNTARRARPVPVHSTHGTDLHHGTMHGTILGARSPRDTPPISIAHASLHAPDRTCHRNSHQCRDITSFGRARGSDHLFVGGQGGAAAVNGHALARSWRWPGRYGCLLEQAVLVELVQREAPATAEPQT